MSIENVKSNVVTVSVSGVNYNLNLVQVLFAVVGSTTSTVYINEGSTPANIVIEGDFRNLVAGAGGSGVNSGPIFGAFTDVDSTSPIVINFSAVNRFISSTSLTFTKYGAVGAFTYNLLESPIDVLGGSGHSLQDVGLFTVNTYSIVLPPVQSAAATATTGGTIVPGTYYIKVTALNAAGESTGSNEITIVVPAGTNTNDVTANWAASTGAIGYKVYVGTSAGAESSYFTVGAVTTLLITAVPGTAGAVPTVNTTFTYTHEVANIKNVSHQVPSGLNWTTTFVDASVVVYIESIKDLVGGP